MKLLPILPFAALGLAFVLPNQEVMSSEAVKNTDHALADTIENLPSPYEVWEDTEDAVIEAWEDTEDAVIEAAGCVQHQFSDAVDYAFDKSSEFGQSFEESFDFNSWVESTEEAIESFTNRPKHPHKKPHHHKPNQTVYELIASSKYTTILAKLVNDYPDLVELLNGTEANYTVFAPTDRAFKKIPEKAPKPSKEDLKKILTYHVSSDFYPAGRVLVTRTIPTLFKSHYLGDEPQRISTQISLKGLTVNYYSRIVAVNIFGTNGVIHGIDSLLVPPPKVIDILKFLPAEFSTLDLALYKTGLDKKMEDTDAHVGGTFFAPSNTAFKRLGTKINAFLFSKYGEKYLKALLKYHLVPNYTLYSDALYKGEEVAEEDHRIPKGRYHIDLPTALEGKSLPVDIARWGRFIEIRINGYNRVSVPDGIAKDGVIQVMGTVLIPPKKPGVVSETEEDLTVEELVERLEPYTEDTHDNYEL